MRLDDLISEAIDRQEGDFVGALLAADIVEKASKAVLDEWLHARAVGFVTVEIGNRVRGIRHRARLSGPRSVFADAAEAADDGDYEPISRFSIVYVVDDENTRRKFGQMTKMNCQYVAATYERSANESMLFAAYLRAVAKRLRGSQTVAERFTEEELVALESQFEQRAA